jgi:hypothetical protein
VKTGDQGFSQGITEIDTLQVSNLDTQVIPRNIFDTRPRLVTSCKLLVQMRVFEKPQCGISENFPKTGTGGSSISNKWKQRFFHFVKT